MKYQIFINQQVLADSSLDLVDAAILDYIIFFCNSANKEVEKRRILVDKVNWTWIDHQKIMRDMPLLRIKGKNCITPRLQRLELEGFITTMRVKNRKKYFHLETKCDELFVKEGEYCSSKGDSTVRETGTYKDNNYKDNIIKGSKEPSLIGIKTDTVSKPPSPTLAIIRYFRQRVKDLHNFDLSVNWKKDGSVVKSFIVKNKDIPIKALIEFFLKSKKFQEHPTIPACFSSDTLNKFRLQNKPSELDELFK